MNATSPEIRSVVVEREFPHPPEKLWRALTQPHLIAEWLMKNDFQPIVGHRFDFSAEWGAVSCEVLVPTPAVRNLIREGKTHQIYSALQTGGQHGMQTMDASLVQLVREHKITRELAEARSSAPEELRRLMGTVKAA